MKFSTSLKKNNDFQRVYKSGTSKANKQLVMYIMENGTEFNRLGISVSKKVGNSVVRHHITRLVRESYRLNEDVFSTGLDIVVIARAAARDLNYFDIEKSLLHLGNLHNITNSNVCKEK
ncbi:MAG: ribonuclease P protein component [Treponemataceae bacterium]|nr:ribonuclease P protein component [Treponemataceae bacterium]